MTSAVLADLYARSGARRWGLAQDAFAAAIGASVAHAFPGRTPADAEARAYADGLHLDDLALVAACAAGHDAAWTHFMTVCRPVLYRAADAIDPSGGARDLADALYADLYGLGEKDGRRQSLLRHFHGRSKLTTWLRAVLSQRYVDQIRARRRIDPLPEESESDALPARPAASADPDRSRFATLMATVLAAAIASLEPRDRLRLRCYYVQDMTLAAIGRMLKEHEATVSRHLTRTRNAMRVAIESSLRSDHGLDARAIAECFASVADDPGALDLGELVGAGTEPGPDRKNPRPGRSK